MEQYIEHQAIPVAGEYDVIVSGGGVAGFAAALAARRRARSVLLIEKSLLLGGLATLGLVNFFEPVDDGKGRQVVFGICDELLRLSVRYGYDSAPPEWAGGATHVATSARYMTRFSPNLFALALTKLATDEGIELLLDTSVVMPAIEGGIVTGVVTENKSGREMRRGKILIDGTGDADLLRRSGVPCVPGKNYFTYGGLGIDIDHCAAAAQSGNIRDAYFAVSGGSATLYGQRHPAGMRYYGGLDGREVSDYVVKNQLLLFDKLRDQPRSGRDVAILSGMSQMRTTCRIDGDATITTEHVNRHVPDSVGVVTDFDNRDALYEIPYRALYRTGHPNLLAVGRCVSAAGYAWDVMRVIPAAIATGEAAGAAAAIAIEKSLSVDNVNSRDIASTLAEGGVLIRIP